MAIRSELEGVLTVILANVSSKLHVYIETWLCVVVLLFRCQFHARPANVTVSN